MNEQIKVQTFFIFTLEMDGGVFQAAGDQFLVDSSKSVCRAYNCFGKLAYKVTASIKMNVTERSNLYYGMFRVKICGETLDGCLQAYGSQIHMIQAPTGNSSPFEACFI